MLQACQRCHLKGGFWSLSFLSLRQENGGPACSGVAWPSMRTSSCSSSSLGTPVPPSPAQVPCGRIAEAAFLQKWKLSLWPFMFQFWLCVKGLGGSHLYKCWKEPLEAPQVSHLQSVWFLQASVNRN